MEAQQPVRLELIRAAEDAHLSIVQEVDNLFTAVGCYIEAHPPETVGDMVRLAELGVSVRDVGVHPATLAKVISAWKKGEDPAWSPLGLEMHVLNEIWAHCESLMLFLAVNETDLSDYNRTRLLAALQTIKVISRRLAQPAQG